MKVFVTGATGFVGHHVARALAAEGAELRLLVRKTSKLNNLEGIAGETHVGDSSEPDSLRPALCRMRRGGARGCGLPAVDSRPRRRCTGQCGWDARVAADGARGGVPRVVYTSSVATMHFRTDGMVINEDTPVSLNDMVGHYKRSKFLAEQEAIAAAEAGSRS